MGEGIRARFLVLGAVLLVPGTALADGITDSASVFMDSLKNYSGPPSGEGCAPMSTGDVSWENISGKPPWVLNWPHWDNIRDKPDFARVDHDHDDTYIPRDGAGSPIGRFCPDDSFMTGINDDGSLICKAAPVADGISDPGEGEGEGEGPVLREGKPTGVPCSNFPNPADGNLYSGQPMEFGIDDFGTLEICTEQYQARISSVDGAFKIEGRLMNMPLMGFSATLYPFSNGKFSRNINGVDFSFQTKSDTDTITANSTILAPYALYAE